MTQNTANSTSVSDLQLSPIPTRISAAPTAPAAFPALTAALLRMENACAGDPAGSRADCCTHCYRPGSPNCPRDSARVELAAAEELADIAGIAAHLAQMVSDFVPSRAKRCRQVRALASSLHDRARAAYAAAKVTA